MDFIVDVQGFKRASNEFVLKELAIIPLEGRDSIPEVYHFKPPCSWDSLPEDYKNSNRWLESNFHGLKWSSGEIPYESIEEILSCSLQGARRVFVKGLQKKRWLSLLLPDWIFLNLDDLGCPSIRRLINEQQTICYLHTRAIKPICAAQNVKNIQTWLRGTNYYKEETSNNHQNNDDNLMNLVIRLKFNILM